MMGRSSFPKRVHAGVLIALILLWASPGEAGSKGKKYFQEGQKLEAAGKFDQAAEQYLLALSESGRPEYHIAYRRAALQASLLLTRRGRELMESGQYEEAYHAFRRAYQFDQTNELARELARRALELAQKGEKDVPAPTGSTFGSPGPPELQAGRARPQSPAEPPQGSARHQEEAKQDVIFRDDLKAVIAQLGRQLGLNVLFDQSVPDRRISVELRGVTKAQALDAILLSNGLFFQPLTENTILVALDQPANRNRLQQTQVQTFYLKHADPLQVQQQLAQMAGQLRAQIMVNQDLRALIVRTTPENLKLFGEIIASIDKEKPEVMIDVSIYEVARNDLIEIGNQLLYEGFFSTPPPAGQIRPGTLNLLGMTMGQVITEQRLALAIPTSIIRFLQTRGRSNLLDSIQVHALDGQQVTANIGRQIPIQTASIPTSFVNVAPTQPGQQPGTPQTGLLNNIFGFGFPQIEYRPVGLNVTITPTVYSDEYVKLEMEVETSGFNEGPTSLTPIFTTRKLKSVATVRTGQAAMMAAVAQKRDEQGRTSIPFLGFLPVIGRFFSIPKQTGNTTDILITVTPHILRAASIEERDRLARLAGTLQSQGTSLTIERFLEQTRVPVGSASAEDVARAAEPEKKGAEPSVTPPTEGAAPSTTTPVTPEGEPIPLSLHLDTAAPRAGEWVQVTLLLNGKEEIREATVTLTYNPQLLRLINVADGGALTSSEAPAEVQTESDSSGRVRFTVRATGPPRPARGRLAVVLFQVLQSGSAPLEIESTSTRFLTADGRTVGCKALPLTVSVR